MNKSYYPAGTKVKGIYYSVPFSGTVVNVFEDKENPGHYNHLVGVVPKIRVHSVDRDFVLIASINGDLCKISPA